MDFTGVGGGLMLALAAGLWLAYLVPNWLRRKEFAATERNAVRLQQTIRVLAETSEAPVVPLPAGRATLPAGRAKSRPPRPMVSTPLDQRRARLRRTRAIASFVLFAGLITTVVQVAVAISTGWSPAGMLVVGTGVVLGVSAIAMLRRLAAVRPGAGVARGVEFPSSVPDIELPVEPAIREWTPVPMPAVRARPAVLPSTMVDPRIAAAAAAEERERAARGADRQVAALAAETSRFAAMGVIDEAPRPAIADLDAVLARRRA